MGSIRYRQKPLQLIENKRPRYRHFLQLGNGNPNERSLGNYPGIISLLRSPKSGQPITIHRTFLSKNGGKAAVPSPKKLMPAAIDGAISELGGSIQLYPLSGDTLGVCEGIETGLCIRSAHPSLPVWPCYSATVLTNFVPPDGVKTVVIWGDLDSGGAGQTAASKLALKLEKLGIKTILVLPGDGVVYINPKDNYWTSREFPIEALIDRIKLDRYKVTSEPGPSLDWADVWKTIRLS